MDAEHPYDLVYNIDPFFEQQQHLKVPRSFKNL